MKINTKCFKSAAIIGLILLASCSTDETEENTTIAIQPESNLPTKYFMGSEVPVKDEGDGVYSLGGSDLLVFEDQLSDSPNPFDDDLVPGAQSKLALGGFVNKWEDNTVVYQLASGLSQNLLNEIQISMNEWSSKTNVKFKKRKNEGTYVTIRPSGQSCNCGRATLGSAGNRGFMELGSGSTAVVIIHEFGHTLGYIHEQNRADRDQFVTVNFNNIQDGFADQFFLDQNAIFLTGQFDIGSTMMYGSFTFSKDRNSPTIVDKNGNLLPNRQARISTGDIAGTNNVYPAAVDPDTGNPCDGVAEWSNRTRYNVGDRVVYLGQLYERDFSRWNFIEACE